MRAFVKVMIGLALVMALVLTGGLVLYMTGNMPSFGIFTGDGIDFYANLDLANRQVYKASDFDSLKANYSSERITLLVGSDDEIVLEEYMSRWEDDMLAKVSTGGGKLEINAGERHIGFFASWRCEIKLYVPRKYLADVVLNNSSGSIRLENDFEFSNFEAKSSSGSVRAQSLASAGDIRLSSTSGSISATELAADGDVTLTNSSGSIKPGRVTAQNISAENTSGSIRFDSATAGTIRAKSSSGSISFDELAGVFDLSGSSGSIRVEAGWGGGKASNTSGSIAVQLREMTSDVSLSSSSGGCRLTVPSDTGFAFEGSTSSGSVKVPDKSGLTFNDKGNHATGTIGGGGPLQVKMEASSGSVRVEYS